LDALDVAEQAREPSGRRKGGGHALGELRNWPGEHAVIVDADRQAEAAAALRLQPLARQVSPPGERAVGEHERGATGRDAWTAAQAVREAEEAVTLAQRRLDGANAGVRLEELERRLTGQRATLAGLAAALEELAPKVAEAERETAALDFRARTRDLEIERLESRRQRLDGERARAREQEARVAAEREALKLGALAADWGGPAESAASWLAELPEEERPRTADEWWRVAERHLDQALRDTFPEEDAEVPEELRVLLAERGGRAAREQARCAGVCTSLASYLRGQEEYEKHQRRQIEAQLVSRQRALAAADKGAEEAAQSTAVHRAALTAA